MKQIIPHSAPISPTRENLGYLKKLGSLLKEEHNLVLLEVEREIVRGSTRSACFFYDLGMKARENPAFWDKKLREYDEGLPFHILNTLKFLDIEPNTVDFQSMVLYPGRQVSDTEYILPNFSLPAEINRLAPNPILPDIMLTNRLGKILFDVNNIEESINLMASKRMQRLFRLYDMLLKQIERDMEKDPKNAHLYVQFREKVEDLIFDMEVHFRRIGIHVDVIFSDIYKPDGYLLSKDKLDGLFSRARENTEKQRADSLWESMGPEVPGGNSVWDIALSILRGRDRQIPEALNTEIVALKRRIGYDTSGEREIRISHQKDNVVRVFGDILAIGERVPESNTRDVFSSGLKVTREDGSVIFPNRYTLKPWEILGISENVTLFDYVSAFFRIFRNHTAASEPRALAFVRYPEGRYPLSKIPDITPAQISAVRAPKEQEGVELQEGRPGPSNITDALTNQKFQSLFETVEGFLDNIP